MNNNDYDDVSAVKELFMAAMHTYHDMVFALLYSPDEIENQYQLYQNLSREYTEILCGTR